jgi:transaldolase/glucose-6-phosphate isomerase
LQAAETFTNLAIDLRSNVEWTGLLLLGMGGSSLLQKLLSLVFPQGELNGQARHAANHSGFNGPSAGGCGRTPRIRLKKTLFVVSSKSGTTSEVQAYFDYFWAKAAEKLGDEAGVHFVARSLTGHQIGKSLRAERKFYAVLAGDPQVGGRYSA